MPGTTLHALGKRHDNCRQLIRVWIEKHDAGAYDDDAQAVDLIAHALTAEANRTEAADILRGLIDRIELTPDEESKKLETDLYGDLAGIRGLAAKQKRDAR